MIGVATSKIPGPVANKGDRFDHNRNEMKLRHGERSLNQTVRGTHGKQWNYNSRLFDTKFERTSQPHKIFQKTNWFENKKSPQ